MCIENLICNVLPVLADLQQRNETFWALLLSDLMEDDMQDLGNQMCCHQRVVFVPFHSSGFAGGLDAVSIVIVSKTTVGGFVSNIDRLMRLRCCLHSRYTQVHTGWPDNPKSQT